MTPKAPKVKKIRQLDPFTEGEKRAEVERRRMLMARGRNSTILTGGGGDRTLGNIGRTMLGGSVS